MDADLAATPVELPHPAPLRAPNRALPWLVAMSLALVLAVWLWNTPPGPLGKADAVGYAICHRIDLRSFHIGDRPLPLCARCTGIYMGLVLGVLTLTLAGRGRVGGLPPTRIILALLSFVGLMGVDGVNSYLHLFPGLPSLYEPNNTLRLITGTLNGLAVSALVFPVFNQTLWADWENRPSLGSFRELGGLLLLAALLIAIVLTENPYILYPLALLSAAGVVALLTALDTTIILIVSRRDAQVTHWRQAVLPLLVGLTLAIIQLGAMDAFRFAIFGTWDGFPLLG